MRRAFLLCMMLAAAPLSGFAQGTAPAPLTGKLLITGSSTMAPLVEELGKRFRTRHPGVAITVESGGSGLGVADALEGKADIGMASRALNPKEKALFAIPIARDDIVFAVHKGNRLGALTRAQLLAVFTGNTTDWKALGGPTARIEVVTRRPGHSSLEIASHYFGIAPEAIKAAHTIGDNAEVVRLTAANRNAIAFLSTGAVTVSARRAGGAIEIAVADTGIGIARADLAKLFKPFAQLDAGLARRCGGVGLGLALARRLAELHGGTIEVESEPGTGSTFTLRFPIEEHS